MSDPTTVMNDLIQCVCTALEDIDRAACGCGLTVGPPVIGPGQCCECGDGAGGQVTANLERLYPADGGTFEQVTRFENCRPGPIAADITVVLARCYPVIDEMGNAPDLDATSEAAENFHTDIAAVWKALKCCGPNLIIRESGVDSDPEGGCSAFAVRVTALVTL